MVRGRSMLVVRGRSMLVVRGGSRLVVSGGSMLVERGGGHAGGEQLSAGVETEACIKQQLQVAILSTSLGSQARDPVITNIEWYNYKSRESSTRPCNHQHRVLQLQV